MTIMDAITLSINPISELTDEQFFQLCQQNELTRYIAAYLYLLETEPDSFLLAAATQDAL